MYFHSGTVPFIFVNDLFFAFSLQCYRVTEIAPKQTVSEKSYYAQCIFSGTIIEGFGDKRALLEIFG